MVKIFKGKNHPTLPHSATQAFSMVENFNRKVNQTLSHSQTRIFPTFKRLKNKTNKTWLHSAIPNQKPLFIFNLYIQKNAIYS